MMMIPKLIILWIMGLIAKQLGYQLEIIDPEYEHKHALIIMSGRTWNVLPWSCVICKI